jgi:UDP-N-acetylmuramyl pentapeptide synthase
MIPRTRLVAVVGTFGKTTTTRAIAAAMDNCPNSGLRDNHHSYLAQMILRTSPGQRDLVIEVGISKPGQMAPYARLLKPDVTVVTSLGSEHQRSLGTRERAREEKAAMVRALGPEGLAVLNGDDPDVRWMAGQTRARIVTFGFSPGNDLWARDIRLEWPKGTAFVVEAGGRALPARIKLIGRHMVYAALAALAVAAANGIPLEEALTRLARLKPTPGRMEPVWLENGACLLRDDFKSAFETYDAALDVLAKVPARRRIAVMGDISEPPGKQGEVYRRLGRTSGEIAARVLYLGEKFETLAVGCRQAGLPRWALTDCRKSVQKAIQALAGDLADGDVVLIKGRTEQRLGRIALGLAGREVRCDLKTCYAMSTPCERCGMLERGWTRFKPAA